MRHLDLFSGIGGFALSAKWAGMNTIGFCEINPFCRGVLQNHFPEVPIYEDIKTLKGDEFKDVDIITAGFPCQDLSCAGTGAGLSGKNSGLVWELLRTIRLVLPKFALLENVAAICNRGLSDILGEMAAIGYDCEWNCIPASEIGAPHKRDRWWGLFTYAQGEPRTQADTKTVPVRKRGEAWELFGDSYWKDTPRPCWEMDKPSATGVGNGFPYRVDRAKSLGNSIVPQIAYQILNNIHGTEVEV